MRVVRDRAEARWLPSRFDFALFRLFAYIRLRRTRPEPRPGIALAVERHQSALENFLVPVVGLIVLAAFIATLIDESLPLGTACALALPAAAMLMNVQVLVVGVLLIPIVSRLPRRQAETGQAVNSFIMLVVVIGAATLLSVDPSPLRRIGTAFLLLAGANAVAFVCLLLLQRSIAEAEARYGVEP